MLYRIQNSLEFKSLRLPRSSHLGSVDFFAYFYLLKHLYVRSVCKLYDVVSSSIYDTPTTRYLNPVLLLWYRCILISSCFKICKCWFFNYNRTILRWSMYFFKCYDLLKKYLLSVHLFNFVEFTQNVTKCLSTRTKKRRKKKKKLTILHLI